MVAVDAAQVGARVARPREDLAGGVDGVRVVCETGFGAGHGVASLLLGAPHRAHYIGFDLSDNYLDTVRAMGPELYERLLQALATGQWPDGSPVSSEQREHTMQAVIAWGELHLPQSERIGFIDKGHKAGGDCDAPQILTVQGGD